MGQILLGIYDDHRIAQEGICNLLKDVPDFDIVLKVHQGDLLIDSLKSTSGFSASRLSFLIYWLRRRWVMDLLK